jgi:hypothetical protein
MSKTIDEQLHKILSHYIGNYVTADEYESDVKEAGQAIQVLIANQVKEARLDELNIYCKFLNDKPADSVVLASELMDRYLDRINYLNGVNNK